MKGEVEWTIITSLWVNKGWLAIGLILESSLVLTELRVECLTQLSCWYRESNHFFAVDLSSIKWRLPLLYLLSYQSQMLPMQLVDTSKPKMRLIAELPSLLLLEARMEKKERTNAREPSELRTLAVNTSQRCSFIGGQPSISSCSEGLLYRVKIEGWLGRSTTQ